MVYFNFHTILFQPPPSRSKTKLPNILSIQLTQDLTVRTLLHSNHTVNTPTEPFPAVRTSRACLPFNPPPTPHNLSFPLPSLTKPFRVVEMCTVTLNQFDASSAQRDGPHYGRHHDIQLTGEVGQMGQRVTWTSHVTCMNHVTEIYQPNSPSRDQYTYITYSSSDIPPPTQIQKLDLLQLSNMQHYNTTPHFTTTSPGHHNTTAPPSSCPNNLRTR